MSDFSFEKDPFENFLRLLAVAESQHVPEFNAMTLSTLGLDGKPSSRLVLFKGMVRGGLSFYTNYQGSKSLQISRNPNVALNFFWPTLERQIRIQGLAEKTTRAESEDYFRRRPRESQIGAWASPQSEVLTGLKELDLYFEEAKQKFKDQQEIPCPPHWGGFIVRPENFEFWFGRKGRLHERYVYEKEGTSWKRFMKFP